jgi:hypothetical protein
MHTNFKHEQTLLSQIPTNKDFTTKIISAGLYRTLFWGITTILTTCNINTYGQITHPAETGTAISANDINAIYSLKINDSKIPPWAIAQLLHVSEDLKRASADGLKGSQPVELNELLADPERYRGKIIALKGMYVKSSDVKEPLGLARGEQCWSVLLLDVKYSHALQIFTSENPERFRKNQLLYAIGVFLTTRVDKPEKDDLASPLVVPVLVGRVLPMAEEGKNTGYSNFSHFLVIIIALTMAYILVRVYVGRKMKKTFDFDKLRR